MSQLGDLYKYLNWKNKSTERVDYQEVEKRENKDTGLYEYYYWDPLHYLQALRILGNLKGEGPRFARTAHLFKDPGTGIEVLAVTKRTISLPRQPDGRSSGSRGARTGAR